MRGKTLQGERADGPPRAHPQHPRRRFRAERGSVAVTSSHDVMPMQGEIRSPFETQPLQRDAPRASIVPRSFDNSKIAREETSEASELKHEPPRIKHLGEMDR
jgi:hypothetical protein